MNFRYLSKKIYINSKLNHHSIRFHIFYLFIKPKLRENPIRFFNWSPILLHLSPLFLFYFIFLFLTFCANWVNMVLKSKSPILINHLKTNQPTTKPIRKNPQSSLSLSSSNICVCLIAIVFWPWKMHNFKSFQLLLKSAKEPKNYETW